MEVLERDDWQCQKCGNKKLTLHVHHLRYLPNKDPWEYGTNDLLTLCADCHEYETETRKEQEDQLIEMLRIRKFMSDDIGCIVDFLLRASEIYHPEHLSLSLRWNLWSKPGVKNGRNLLAGLIENFQTRGKGHGKI